MSTNPEIKPPDGETNIYLHNCPGCGIAIGTAHKLCYICAPRALLNGHVEAVKDAPEGSPCDCGYAHEGHLSGCDGIAYDEARFQERAAQAFPVWTAPASVPETPMDTHTAFWQWIEKRQPDYPASQADRDPWLKMAKGAFLAGWEHKDRELAEARANLKTSNEMLSDARVVIARIRSENERLRGVADQMAEALEWAMAMEPSPCRCLDFATPLHVCKGHRALSAHSALGKGTKGGTES